MILWILGHIILKSCTFIAAGCGTAQCLRLKTTFFTDSLLGHWVSSDCLLYDVHYLIISGPLILSVARPLKNMIQQFTTSLKVAVKVTPKFAVSVCTKTGTVVQCKNHKKSAINTFFVKLKM